MLLLLLLVCAVVVLMDNGIDVAADVVGEEEAVDRSDTSADEGGVEAVVVRKAEGGWEIAVALEDVPVAASTPNVLVHAVAESVETETPYLMSMPG